MEEKIRICIADNNKTFVEKIKKFFSDNAEISIAGTCNNGKDTIQTILEEKIDILLLDIVIPVFDGIEVIDRINAKIESGQLKERPGIIIISAIAYDNIKFNLFERGINYYINKPIELDFLERRIKDVYYRLNNCENDKMDKIISNKLNELGIHPNLVGYKYIKHSIKMIIKKPLMADNFKKNIYPIIAEIENVSVFKVEKGINYAIKISWNKSKNKVLEIFKTEIYKNRPPSARVFIFTIRELIKYEWIM